MRLLVVAVVGMTGCFSGHARVCEDGTLCPVEQVCHFVTDHTICVDPGDLVACDGKPDGTPCGDGAFCNGGLCIVTCGNGKVDPGETCDDLNTMSADGCSSTCQSERCGNGVTDALEECDDGNQLEGDGCGLTCLSERATWIDISPVPLSPRAGMSMAFDVLDGTRDIAFGGVGPDRIFAETWAYATGSWTRLSPPTSPPARERFGMTAAGMRGVIVFGGEGDRGALDDTWAWDGSTWTALVTAHRPPARFNAQIAYDPFRDRILLFGGTAANGQALGDLWELGDDWVERTPAGMPPADPDTSIAFDTSTNTAVLCDHSDGKTYLWNGTTWTAPALGGGCPNSTPFRSMRTTFDPVRNSVVAMLDDGRLFSWLGAVWLPGTQTNVPTDRKFPAFFYDPFAQGLVLVGGHTNGDFLDGESFVGDVWTLPKGDSAWVSTPTSEVAPSPRAEGAIAYDAYAGRTILYGGRHSAGNSSETWIHDLTGWRRATSDYPPARRSAAMAFDPPRGQLVLFGGLAGTSDRLDETWTFDGEDTWTILAPPVKPPAREGAALVSDGQRVVLFGGSGDDGVFLADTWQFDGTAWTQLAPATSPPPRAHHAMVYDPVRARVVLFGGRDLDNLELGDTWELDGTTWTQLHPATSPPARRGARLVFDPLRRRAVLLGGFQEATATTFADRWEWDGTAWTSLGDDPLGARTEGHVVFDAIRGGILLFGGLRSPVVGAAAQTQLLRADSGVPRETCLLATDDLDGDGLAGCDDEDCWGRCHPACVAAACSEGPSCGDGTCATDLEDRFICPVDCL